LWRKQFILLNAQVSPLLSCPYTAKLLVGLPLAFLVSSATLISNEPEPQVGSKIRSPSFGDTNLARRPDTSLGVKNSPLFFPAPDVNFSNKYIYASPKISSLSSHKESLKSSSGLAKSLI